MDGRHIAARVVFGQMTSLATASTGIFVTLLVHLGCSVPALQTLTAYAAVALCIVPVRGIVEWRAANARPSGDVTCRLRDVLYAAFLPTHFEAWRYVVIAAFDFSANTLAVWAYHYTDIISVQLLDCFTVPMVMLLSRVVFRRVPSFVQLVGAVIALAGMGLLVLLDSLHDTTTAKAPNPLLGDALCIAASVCYATSNVACEAILKARPAHEAAVHDLGAGEATAAASDGSGSGVDSAAHDDDDTRAINAGNGEAAAAPPTTSREDQPPVDAVLPAAAGDATPLRLGLEYVSFVALFGLIIAAVFVACRWEAVRATHGQWTGDAVAYQLGFAAVMVVIYTCMPMLFALASATFANLSLLSADVYAIVLNMAVFGVAPEPAFVAPFALIVGGVLVYEGAASRVVAWWRQRG